MTTANYRDLVHTPAELAAEHVAWAEHIKSDPGVRFGIPAIDKIVLPMRAGDLVSIIARPSMGKTSLMACFAREHAQRLMALGPDGENRAVVYVTWEQSAEELETFFQADGDHSISDIAWGKVDMDIIKAKAIKRARVPIWVIGHGIGRAGRKVPRMTPDVVLGAIETMKADFGITPSLMLFDYMQLIPVEHARDRIQQVTEVPIRVKELALRVGAPAIVAVQAGRSVDERDIKIPEMRDGQWSSSIEQTSDKVFGLWRPAQTERIGQAIAIGDQTYTVQENLLIIRLLKQRGEQGRHTWPMFFDPAYLKLAELETRYQ